MGRYTIRNGELKAKKVQTEEFEVRAPYTNDGIKTAPFIKLYAPEGATQTVGYLYIGSGGSLRLSSSAPIGTSGVYTNVGTHVATVA